MLEREPEELAIGPVTFRSRRNFGRRISQAVHIYSTNGNKFDRALIAGALRYYRSFKWIAEVSVLPADDKMSKNLAVNAVTSALNAIHTTFGARATDKMVIGGPRIRADTRAHLRMLAMHELSPSISLGGAPGQFGFAKGWSKDLQGSDAANSLSLFGLAIEASLRPASTKPLCQRILDSLH